jgi:hypothetical protein
MPYKLRVILGLVVTLLAASPLMAVSFDFGISPLMTVLAGQTVSIDAVITNRSTTSITFGDLDFSCPSSCSTNYTFGAGIGASSLDAYGLNPLNFHWGPGFDPNAVGNADSFANQFVGLVLAPNQSFDFTFGTITFDPSSVTVAHPTVEFRMGTSFVYIPITISVADQISCSPLTYTSSASGQTVNDGGPTSAPCVLSATPSPFAVVPEPPSIALLGIGVLAVFAFAGWRKYPTHHSTVSL